jgi:uracil-DNA glycosylase family 4
MVRKVKDTPGCAGCPLFEHGNKNFVPDIVRQGAEVFVLGQNPGADEEAQGVPFVGQTGQMMDRDFFPQAKLTREQVSIGNALRCRWQNSNELPKIEKKVARGAVEHCSRAHLRVPSGTRLLVATGAYALYAATGHGHAKGDKISHWRGWMLPLKESLGGKATCASDIYTPRHGDTPVLCTVHVAAVGYDPSLRLPAKSDWQKVRRYLRGTWPERPPDIRREVDEDLFDYEAAWDTEFIPERNKLLRFSAATGGGDVYCVESYPGMVQALRRYGSVLEALPKPLQMGLQLRLVNGVWQPAHTDAAPVLRIFFQNADADLPYLARIFPEGITICIEDEMLAHSVLHGGFPHSLDYLASLHASINRHKHLQYTNEVVYSAMDAFVQYQVWREIEKELKADPGSEREYRESVLPLVPIILEAEEAGILIDQAEVARGVEFLEHDMRISSFLANAATGYKINLGSSQQVGRQLYDVEDIKPPKGRR